MKSVGFSGPDTHLRSGAKPPNSESLTRGRIPRCGWHKTGKPLRTSVAVSAHWLAADRKTQGHGADLESSQAPHERSHVTRTPQEQGQRDKWAPTGARGVREGKGGKHEAVLRTAIPRPSPRTDPSRPLAPGSRPH